MKPTEINELDIPSELGDKADIEASEPETVIDETDIEATELETEAVNEVEDGKNPDMPPSEHPDNDTTLSELLESDYDELTAEFPELLALGDIAKMESAIRYGELRELGLSPREAYLATRKRVTKERSARAHLTPASPHSLRKGGITMPRAELKIARELFEGLSDSEIEALYKKVTRT